MKNKQTTKKLTNFDYYLKEQLKDPKMKKYYDEVGKQLEISYKILQLRKRLGISQSQFAKKLGTTINNVVRLEAAEQDPTILTLYKIAKVLKRDLRIEFV